jgi:hypothetical protein
MIRRAVAALVLGFALAPPASGAEGREGDVRKLLELSDVAQSLSQWPMMISRLADDYRDLVDSDTFSAVHVSLTHAYDSERARRTIVRHLAQEFDPEAFQAIQWWYTSELGAKIVRAERDAGSPEGMRAIRVKPPAPERLEAAKRYDRASGKSASLTRTSLGMTRGLLAGMKVVIPEKARVPQEQLDRELALMERQLPDAFRSQVLPILLYMQKDLTPEEVSEFLLFVESDSAAWLFESYLAGLDRALDEAGRTFREELARRLAPEGD